MSDIAISHTGMAHELSPSPTTSLLAAYESQWFDYASLDPVAAATTRGAIARIKTRLHSSICETGRDLIGIKSQMGHGLFGSLVACELGIGLRTAENYMAVARFVEGKSESVSLLPPSALYALAAPSAQPEIVEEVLAAVDAGKFISVNEIRQRLNPLAGARRKRHGLKSAEQLQRALDNEKRRRAADVARQQKDEDGHETMETAHNANALDIAHFLAVRLSLNDVAELLSLLAHETDWELVEQHLYCLHGQQSSSDATETRFGTE